MLFNNVPSNVPVSKILSHTIKALPPNSICKLHSFGAFILNHWESMKSAATGERYCQHAFMVDVFTSSHVTLLTSLQSPVFTFQNCFKLSEKRSLRFGLYACIYFGMIRHVLAPLVHRLQCQCVVRR